MFIGFTCEDDAVKQSLSRSHEASSKIMTLVGYKWP